MESIENYALKIIENLKDSEEKNVLIVGEEVISNKGFHKRVSEIVYILKEEHSIRCGQRVLIASVPNVEFYCIAVAVLAVGGVIVILDPSMTFDRIDHCISTAKPTFFVYPKGSLLRFLKYLFPAVRAIPKVIELRPFSSPVPLMQPSDVVLAEHALVTFTTGSTGMPKLIIREHAFLLKQSKSLSMSFLKLALEFGVGSERDNPILTNLPVLPLHTLRIGGLVAMIPKFTKCDPAVVINTIKTHNISCMIGSPAFATRLSNYASQHHMMLPINVVGIGGAPVFRHTLRSIASTVKDKKVVVIYGATEAEPISIITAKEKMELEKSKPDGLCVGKPAVEGSVKIIRVSDEPFEGASVDVNQLEVPRGEIGEVILTGWHVNVIQVEKKRLIHVKDGTLWLRIEDAAFMDAEGRIWLAGRVKWRSINQTSGATYWSSIVEQKILERTSLITFAAYLPNGGRTYLFVEAPNGLPAKELEGLKTFIKHEGIPVDELVVKQHIKKDRRHASKPDTGALFAGRWSGVIHVASSLFFVLTRNTLLLIVTIMILVLIVMAVCFSFM